MMPEHILQKLLLFWFLLPVTHAAFSQNEASFSEEKPQIFFSGVVDVFYSFDFNQPDTPYRQPFLYNHNRHSEFNLNIGMLRSAVSHSKYRAQIGIQAGTYAEDNYAAEQNLLKHIFEANAGIALHEKVWIDAGIFGSHIGFESAVTSENWTLTRSLLAENSPYFLSGARLSWSASDRWNFAALVTNGWQRVQRVPGNSLPGFGTQVSYSNGEKLLLNWSTFLGTDDPDSTRRLRYFNNFYGQFNISEKFGVIAGFDIGAQQEMRKSSDYGIWFSPVVIGRYIIHPNWASAIRAEYYSDANSFIISPVNTHAFQTSGFSANLDYTPAENVMWRLEGRLLKSTDSIFFTEQGFSNNTFFLTSSITVKIQD